MQRTAFNSPDFDQVRQPALPTPRLLEGSRVRVISGPFKDAAGVVEGEPAERLTLVRTEVLGRPVTLELHTSALELVAAAGVDA